MTISPSIQDTFDQAKQHFENSRLRAAIDGFNLFLELSDKNQEPIHNTSLVEEQRWFAHYSLGKLAERQAQQCAAEDKPIYIEKCISSYTRATQIRPWRLEPWVDLARLYRSEQQLNQAKEHIDYAIRNSKPEREQLGLFDVYYDSLRWFEHALICVASANEVGLLQSSRKALRYPKLERRKRDLLLALRKPVLQSINQKKHSALHSPTNRQSPSNKRRRHTNKKRTSTPAQAPRIRVVVPFRNAASWLPICLASIRQQSYSNFTAHFIDDASTDDARSLFTDSDPRIRYQLNDTRQGALRNRLNFILECEPNDVVMYLDGDDQLASDSSLLRLASLYQETDCWLSYGQYVSQHGELGHAQPYANQADLDLELKLNQMRFPIHPISHRAGLMQSLSLFDPNYACFKDNNGRWLEAASDAVLARPLFFMAGFERIQYCDDVLVFYNQGHEHAEAKAQRQEQLETCRLIGQRPAPPKLSSFTEQSFTD